VRGMVKSFGGRVPSCSTGVFSDRAPGAIPAGLRDALGPVVTEIEHLSGLIDQCGERLQAIAKERYPQSAALTQVHGVGWLTAL